MQGYSQGKFRAAKVQNFAIKSKRAKLFLTRNFVRLHYVLFQRNNDAKKGLLTFKKKHLTLLYIIFSCQGLVK